jgi:hypothetical protein
MLRNGKRQRLMTFQQIRHLVIDIGVLTFAVLCAILYHYEKSELYSTVVYVTMGYITKDVMDKAREEKQETNE